MNTYEMNTYEGGGGGMQVGEQVGASMGGGGDGGDWGEELVGRGEEAGGGWEDAKEEGATVEDRTAAFAPPSPPPSPPRGLPRSSTVAPSSLFCVHQ